MIKVVEGNILRAQEEYIIHQCNCVSHAAGGLAFQIFKEFTWADSYSNRNLSTVPGTIEILGDELLGQRKIVNLYGQVYPGKPKDPISLLDGHVVRERYFLDGLKLLKDHIGENTSSVAFPWQIGCGLAGGEWSHYLLMMTDFSSQMPNVDVVMYRFDP